VLAPACLATKKQQVAVLSQLAAGNGIPQQEGIGAAPSESAPDSQKAHPSQRAAYARSLPILPGVPRKPGVYLSFLACRACQESIYPVRGTHEDERPS
jgi:hypothetical protein